MLSLYMFGIEVLIGLNVKRFFWVGVKKTGFFVGLFQVFLERKKTEVSDLELLHSPGSCLLRLK